MRNNYFTRIIFGSLVTIALLLILLIVDLNKKEETPDFAALARSYQSDVQGFNSASGRLPISFKELYPSLQEVDPAKGDALERLLQLSNDRLIIQNKTQGALSIVSRYTSSWCIFRIIRSASEMDYYNGFVEKVKSSGTPDPGFIPQISAACRSYNPTQKDYEYEDLQEFNQAPGILFADTFPNYREFEAAFIEKDSK
jgi:hypothetical protein